MAAKLKLFIIDDEAHIRTLLKFIVDWESLGIEICGEASCAEEGLQLLDELQPNIVFSDICMDYMDGIEFCRIAKKKYPYIRMVLLSGHSVFDYASRGIEAGVSAYLLKPLEEEKIIETVQKIKEEIYNEQKKEKEYQETKAYLEENKTFLIANSLNALLQPNCNLENILKQLNWFDVSFSNSFFQIILFELHITDGDPFLISSACGKLLEKQLSGIAHLYLFHDLNYCNVLLSNNPQFDLLPAMEEIKVLFMEQMNCPFTIGVGQPGNTLKSVSRSFQSAKDAVHYRTILGNNQIIQYSYVWSGEANAAFSLEEAVSGLLQEIKAGRLSGAFEIIENCMENQISMDSSDFVPVRVMVSTIVNHLSNYLIQNGLRDTDAFGYCMNAQERVFRLETVSELKNMTKNLTHSVLDAFSSARSSQNGSIMQEILEYLEEHYADQDLSLTSTAQRFYLNSSYLSRLFRQRNEITFSGYLTNLRLKKAGEMLLDTKLRAYEISEKVGFRDAKYFSSSFRKFYGMTTNEYRASHAG